MHASSHKPKFSPTIEFDPTLIMQYHKINASIWFSIPPEIKECLSPMHIYLTRFRLLMWMNQMSLLWQWRNNSNACKWLRTQASIENLSHQSPSESSLCLSQHSRPKVRFGKIKGHKVHTPMLYMGLRGQNSKLNLHFGLP